MPVDESIEDSVDISKSAEVAQMNSITPSAIEGWQSISPKGYTDINI